PKTKVVLSFIPVELRGQFWRTDDQVREIVRTAKHATDFYGSVRDMEGAVEEGKISLVQSRAITTIMEVSRPKKVEIKKTVVNELAAKEAEARGDLLAVGAKGRNAFVGEI